MPCQHKFINDLQLEYVNWEVRTLFIGTFNPNWIACNNNAEWFYGRKSKNEFWGILPFIHEGIELLNGNRDIWMNFCSRNNLAITDIITSVNNVVENNPIHRNWICKFKDKDLENLDVTINNIPEILIHNNNIQQICFTRSTLNPFWSNCLNPTLNWINNNHNRNIEIRYLRSPSRGARKGVVGNFNEFISNKWLEKDYQIL